ncbi:prepilin peptidase [Salmonella bongori]|uniref:Prepilin leader peptidase/N-methyltransferase n=1 Tax=Salmonella bongori serovar 44:r:- TaxID=1967585 RepID=A0A702BRK6_SALBN|nr:A24 family peptidase [Salmonella bongori]EGS1130237.1 prepilin peptidase [Salmonella bongori CFSAN000509]HAC6696222.1 prepilin peptidase [Salmonella bongori serovar 44:r:-]
MTDVIVHFYFWFDLILVSVIGLCVGSFLNVVIYRIPLSYTCHGGGMSVAFPPSHCPVCKHSIPARDNIPLVSYILLKGRCRFCHERINVLYPVTEGATFIAFICFYMLFFNTDIVLFLLSVFLFCLLYVISIIDFRYYIIPDRLLLVLFGGGVVYSYLYGNIIYDALGLVIYFLIFAIIVFACESFSDKQILGMGDIKFYLSVVPWAGGLNFPFVMLISSIAGLCLAGVWQLYVKKIYVSNELTKDIDENRFIPFGPAIAVALLIVYLAGLLR